MLTPLENAQHKAKIFQDFLRHKYSNGRVVHERSADEFYRFSVVMDGRLTYIVFNTEDVLRTGSDDVRWISQSSASPRTCGQLTQQRRLQTDMRRRKEAEY